MTVDELVAGRELDALVAKMMGWFGGDDWSPSTDIRAAWDVVERFQQKGECFTLYSGYSGTTYWRARFGFNSWEIEAEAPTVPLAICRAALKAVNSV